MCTAPGIGVMYQLTFPAGVLVSIALPLGHLEGGQDEPCLVRCGCGQADDAAGEGVHDEGDVADGAL